MSGRLYLVGVGPGDPELLTLKGARILGETRIVAFPKKTGEPSFSYQIAETHLNPDAELLPVDIPMAVDPAPARAAYDALAELLAERLQGGADVAYLCEGDPLFYGSAIYLAARLGHDHNVEIIPGITSLCASAAALGRPLCARNEILKVLPAPLDDEILLKELSGAASVAIVKIGRHLPRLRTLLQKTGHLENAMIVQYASGPGQLVLGLKDFPGNIVPYFSTILCYGGSGNWS